MKKYSRYLFVLTALFAVIISACGGTEAETETSTGGDKPRASLVEFTGVIEAIDGNQWTVNGQVITVDPTVLRDGPFEVGDTVKVEAEVQADGAVIVTQVEPPAADDNVNDDNGNAGLGNVNGNANANSNSNSNNNSNVNGNSNDNSNDGNSNGNSNDDNSNDDDSDNGNSNDNGDDDDNSNGDEDDDDNSNGDDDDDDNDDNSGSGGGDD